jgi:hypothetical protein
MRRGWIGVAVLAAGASAHAGEAASPSTAQQSTPADSAPTVVTPSPITDHLALDAIFFYGHVATTGTFNSSTGTPGTPFSAEHDLGLTDQAVQAQIELMVRMEQRSRLRLDFIDLRRQGSAVLDQTIQFGNQTYTPGQLVQSEIDWRQTDFTYTYSFLRNDRFELGAGLGVHLIQTEATASSPNSPQRSDYSAAGPFATFALDGVWRMARDWSFSARGQYFHLTAYSGSGSLGEYHADVQYRWRPNFAVGAGFQYELVELQVQHSNPDELNGSVRLKIDAPELFLRLSL